LTLVVLHMFFLTVCRIQRHWVYYRSLSISWCVISRSFSFNVLDFIAAVVVSSVEQELIDVSIRLDIRLCFRRS
jgi:hypothetical protein